MRPPRWVRIAIALLPRQFREEYGDAIGDVATRRIREGGSSVAGELSDLTRTIAREWLTVIGHGVRSMGKGGREPMQTMMQDIRYAVRMMLKTPIVSMVAVLSLALGIAATSAALALYDGFLRNNVAWEDGDQILRVGMTSPRYGSYAGGLTPASWVAFSEGSDLFRAAAWMESEVTNLVEPDLAPEQIQLMDIGGDVHGIVGEVPFIGRAFVAADQTAGAEKVVILTYSFWERRYGADRGVLGRQVRIGGIDHTVIGVMPEAFELIPATIDVMRAGTLEGRSTVHAQALFVVGLPIDGVGPERIETELRGIQASVVAADPEAYEDWSVTVMTLSDSLMGSEDQLLVKLLLVVALFGLLIACANVANLLLARAEERQREVSVRTALGAGRGRILSQLLTESVVLAAIGGAFGIGASIFLVDLFGLSMPAELPPSLYPALSPFVLSVSVGITFAAGLIFGLAPALHAVKADLRGALSGSRGGTAGRRGQRVRNAFVIAEFAVAVGLLSGATMLVQALGAITGGDPGFRSEGVMTFTLQPLEDRYPEAAQLDALREQVVASLEARPEIRAGAVLSQLPRAQNGASRVTEFSVVGGEEASEENALSTMWVAASAGYPSTFDVDLVDGRWLESADGPESEPVAVVTRRFAELHFPGESAIGRSIVLTRDQGTGGEPAMPRRIVGIAEDVALQRIEISAMPSPAVYLPHGQVTMRTAWFAVNTNGAAAGVARAIREAVAAVDPTLPVGSLKTMERHVADQLAGPRMIGGFVAGVGLIALILAALGIYGVMSHSVVQRTREIGIRMAMGAERSSVIGMVIRSGLGLVLVGMITGLPLAWLMTRVTLSAMGDLTEVFPIWQTGGIVTAMLATVAAVACLIPAVRASTIRPSRAIARD